MTTAFAYARVSTKDQAVKDNSIPEQFIRIGHYAKEKGIELLHQFQDSDSAYKDDNRQNFETMIAKAIEERPDYILVDDSSRFARTRKKAIDTKHLLRYHGVNIVFVNEPYVDPKTVTGLWVEGIQEIKNEATSREIAFHTMKGMTHNLKARDLETGWCYKNGGMAPYGYKTVYLTRGHDHKGKPIIKTVWELNTETAAIVKEIIVDLFTTQEMSYRQIRDVLNSRGILSPGGAQWATTTLVEMLKENRLEQYAGTAFWNKENKHTKGVKYNPRDQWVVSENAHPEIITKDELDLALQRRRKNQYIAPAGATRESTYLLTGTNIEGNSMFVCGHCGGNVIGYGNSSHQWKKYICGVNRTRGPMACDNKWLIEQKWLENIIVAEIEKRYTTPEKVDVLIKDVSSRVSIKNKEIDISIVTHEKQFKKYEIEINRLLDAIKSGIDPSLISKEVNSLKQKMDGLEVIITTLKQSFAKETNVDIEALRNFFANFKYVFENTDIKEKRQLIRTFVRKIELVPESKEIRIEFYPDHLVQSIGARDRGRTGTRGALPFFIE